MIDSERFGGPFRSIETLLAGEPLSWAAVCERVNVVETIARRDLSARKRLCCANSKLN